MKTHSSCACAALAATLVIGMSAQSPSSGKPAAGQQKFGPDARVVWTPGAASELSRHLESSPWKPSVNSERPRGGVEVYSKVAPAVVVVRTENAHGTGFLVSADGQMLTNHHVVSSGLRHDNQRAASYAMVHLGRLGKDGVMSLRPEAVRAFLLKSDPAVDLALLKLESIPTDLQPVPFLQMAPAAPRPGMPATIVGHPASGMLWTLRSGQVSSIGRMPADLVDLVMLQLAASPGDRQEILDRLKQEPSRRIILTSAGVNPGDSGGPVVDSLGRVIAVTFAIPADPARAKFSYHIHLDEVRAFMAKVPTAPKLDIPDPWQLGPNVELADLDRDGRPDVLFGGTENPDMLLFDLDNDSGGRDVAALVRSRKWDFEFALRVAASEPTSTAFYDTDNDGSIDLIHTVEDRDHSKNTRFTRLGADKWNIEQNVKLMFPSATYLKDKALSQRLGMILSKK
jgi:S1-C subfamily serine protease